LVIGLAFLSVLNWIMRGRAFPLDASTHNWIWLSLSGFIGFVIGDFFLLKSFTIIGSWFAMLIMTLAPPLAAVFGWILLDEQLSMLAIAGILITMTGIAVAMFRRDKESRKITTSKSMKGILYAFVGALGQALGIVLSKYGMADYSPFAATQIRIIMGIVGLVIIITALRKWPSVFAAFSQLKPMINITVGAFFGPFLGVSFSLLAITYTSTGIASTIMALVPIFIIPPSIWFFNHKVTLREIIGTIISIGGVALFFL
jgi:drug/metabolite transporter (DMT)-like permease